MANSPIGAVIDDFSHLLSSARPFSYPAQYHVPAESPLVANSEARNLALPDQFVNRHLLEKGGVAGKEACTTILTMRELWGVCLPAQFENVRCVSTDAPLLSKNR